LSSAGGTLLKEPGSKGVPFPVPLFEEKNNVTGKGTPSLPYCEKQEQWVPKTALFFVLKANFHMGGMVL